MIDIDPFPGRKMKKVQKFVLTNAQKAWLRKWHPVTENKVLEQMSGYSHVTLARFIRELGLKKSGEGFKAIMQRKGQRRRELHQREKRRVMYGIHKQTRIYTPVESYNKAQTSCRRHAKEKGYILSSDCKEGSPSRWIIYYSDETPRNEVFERNCNKNGFKVEKWRKPKRQNIRFQEKNRAYDNRDYLGPACQQGQQLPSRPRQARWKANHQK